MELALSAPDRIGVQLDFTDRLEHRLMAGADIFLMPSLYEPCGLTQMRSQRYGAPPIVRSVGGLRDTVEDGVTGFTFDAYTAEAFAETSFRALDCFADTARWQTMVRRGMAHDFSWERSVGPVPGCLSARAGAARCPMSGGRMDFVLTLHSHLPYVLNHGRWPHGSDWICEAAFDTYLPLLETLRRLGEDATPAPVTIGFTPVLANQLASPTFVREMEAFFDQRLTACAEAPASLSTTGETHLLPLVEYWRDRLRPPARAVPGVDGDLVSAFRALEAAGRLEIIGSAATHGFLPLLARDESIRLQLAVGHGGAPPAVRARAVGMLAAGVRLPAARSVGTVADRPAKRRAPRHRGASGRRGIPLLLRRCAPRRAPGARSGCRAIRRRSTPRSSCPAPARVAAPRSARPIRPTASPIGRGAGDVAAYVRDPARVDAGVEPHEGYPGRRRVSRVPQDALARRPQALAGDAATTWISAPRSRTIPAPARDRAPRHAEHFAGLLGTHRRRRRRAAPRRRDRRAVRYRALRALVVRGPRIPRRRLPRAARQPDVRPITGSRHLAAHPPRTGDPDARRLVGRQRRLHHVAQRRRPRGPGSGSGRSRKRFWDVAPGGARRSGDARFVLAQAARELLLAQSSDWQFIISTGAVADYGERRFTEHCSDTEELVAALADGSQAALDRGHRRAARAGRAR